MKIKQLFVLIIGIGLLLLYFHFNPSKVNFFPKCVFYESTGLYCPGCGSQRATYHLLHFNILGVLQQNALYLAGLFVLFYYFFVQLYNRFRTKKLPNYLNHPKTPMIVLFIILVFWILRNIPIYPFTLLSPK